MAERKITVRVLTGPTCSGKTALGVRLARELGLDVICMDSMQIYRGMDIGTAKPTAEERQGVEHHMLDIRDPADGFSVNEYRDMAETLVKRLWTEKHRGVLFVGGTGLYLAAMMHPLGMGGAEADQELREKLKALAADENGRERLHRMLEKEDPETAARLPVNDVRRAIRAIEVTRRTGIPFSKQPPRETDDAFSWRVACPVIERETLYARINARVDGMIRAGLRDEVAALLESGVPEDTQSMGGLGYKEMIPCIRGKCTLEEAVEKIKAGTRRYAKRQGTFLRRETAVKYFDALGQDAYVRMRELLAADN